MPINPEAVGEVGEPKTRSWTSKDALLYAVGVGAAKSLQSGSAVPQLCHHSSAAQLSAQAELLTHHSRPAG